MSINNILLFVFLGTTPLIYQNIIYQNELINTIYSYSILSGPPIFTNTNLILAKDCQLYNLTHCSNLYDCSKKLCYFPDDPTDYDGYIIEPLSNNINYNTSISDYIERSNITNIGDVLMLSKFIYYFSIVMFFVLLIISSIMAYFNIDSSVLLIISRVILFTMTCKVTIWISIIIYIMNKMLMADLFPKFVNDSSYNLCYVSITASFMELFLLIFGSLPYFVLNGEQNSLNEDTLLIQ